MDKKAQQWQNFHFWVELSFQEKLHHELFTINMIMWSSTSDTNLCRLKFLGFSIFQKKNIVKVMMCFW